MQPTSRAAISQGKAGFTLIEMLAVMVIVALIAALAVTNTRGTGRAQLKAVALQTVALFRRERLGAILTARNRQVSIDGERRALLGDAGDVVAIPRDVTIDILGLDERWSGRQAVVRFLPDGASFGTVVKLSREGAAYEVRVNWYTGSVTLEAL